MGASSRHLETDGIRIFWLSFYSGFCFFFFWGGWVRAVWRFMGYGRKEVVVKASRQRRLLNKLKHKRGVGELEAALAYKVKGLRAAAVTLRKRHRPAEFLTSCSPSAL